MNLIDGHVIEVLTEPTLTEIGYTIDVKYWDDGGISTQPKTLGFATKEQAEKVEKGYIFQH